MLTGRPTAVAGFQKRSPQFGMAPVATSPAMYSRLLFPDDKGHLRSKVVSYSGNCLSCLALRRFPGHRQVDGLSNWCAAGERCEALVRPNTLGKQLELDLHYALHCLINACQIG
jgi:hypothetical protein